MSLVSHRRDRIEYPCGFSDCTATRLSGWSTSLPPRAARLPGPSLFSRGKLYGISEPFCEGEVRRFRIETRALIAREGMLGCILQRVIADVGVLQRPINRFAARLGHVRSFAPEIIKSSPRICVARANDPASAYRHGCLWRSNRPSHGHRTGTPHGRRGGRRSKPTTPIFPDATLVGMFGKPVQTSAAIGIEMRDRSLRGVLLVAETSGVIESDHDSRWFDATIDFRGSGNKSIPDQPNTGA